MKTILFLTGIFFYSTLLGQTKIKMDSSIKEQYMNGTWQQMSKSEYTYFPSGKVERMVRFASTVDKTGWIPFTRHHYSYSAGGLLLQTTNESWKVGANTWDSSGKIIRIYDSENKLIALENWSWDYLNSEWTKTKSDSNVFDLQDVRIESYMKYTDHGNTINFFKMEYIYHGDGRLDYSTFYQDSSGTWLKRQQKHILYDGAKNVLGHEYRNWVESLNRFEPVEHRTYVPDANDNPADIYDYRYHSPFVNDVRLQRFSFDLAVDVEDVNLALAEEMDLAIPFKNKPTELLDLLKNGANWDSLFRSTYFYSPASPNGGDDLLSDKTKVYPNPASGLVYLDMGDNVKGFLRVYDGKGGLVMERALQERVNHLDVSKLEAGIYILQLATQQGQHSVRLAIE